MKVLKHHSKIRRNSLAIIGLVIILTSYFQVDTWWTYAMGCLLLLCILRYESSSELRRFFNSIWFVYLAWFILLLAGGADRDMTIEALGNVALMAGFFFPIFLPSISIIPYYQVKWLLPYELRTFKRAVNYVFYGWLLFWVVIIGLFQL
ncbi:hypothetical protein P4V41_03310 [Fictibacillus nanhaiensis]|uniref:hypothetical protein n=1 Tax=Fictibacillus nanhaiensis TaxID=742169 RepID=UPI002E242864|nr:hypothetical protein [Fictibacillus nanhaiensis]